MYYALIGDMIGSKKLDPDIRRAAQDKLRNELEYLNGSYGIGGIEEKRRIDRIIEDENRAFFLNEAQDAASADPREAYIRTVLRELGDRLVRPAEHIRSGFFITLGDEFQGLLECAGDPVVEIIKIVHEMRPFEFRFAIGCGDIYTAIDSKAAIGADGPAYHNARRMIERMKTESGARIRVALGDPDLENTLNTVLTLCDKLKEGWTDKQEQLVYCMLLSEIYGKRMTQEFVAGALGMRQSSVNQRLKTAGFGEYFKGLDLVRKKLSGYMSGNEGKK